MVLNKTERDKRNRKFVKLLERQALHKREVAYFNATHNRKDKLTGQWVRL